MKTRADKEVEGILSFYSEGFSFHCETREFNGANWYAYQLPKLDQFPRRMIALVALYSDGTVAYGPELTERNCWRKRRRQMRKMEGGQ